MSFTCKYCGKNFCSEHRLPENHDCEGLEDGVRKEKESVEVEEDDSSNDNSKKDQKWFKDQDLKEEKIREPQRNSLLQDIVETFRNSMTLMIIGVTVFFYLVQMLIPGAVENILILDPSISEVLSKPWTLFTVMLVHGGSFHLFANMVTFYFFGSAVENVLDRMEMLKLYLGAGLVASISFVLFRNLLATLHGPGMLGPAVGASGAVVAFVGMVGVLYPDAEVLLYFVIPMRLQTAVKAFIGLESFNLLAKTFAVNLPLIGMFASSAHLSGLLIGVWYGKKVRKRISRSAVFNPFNF